MQKKSIFDLNRISVDSFHQKEKLPLVIVLDNIRSVYNVGSIFRTCDAFLIECIYLCGITGKPPHVEIHKTALGAEQSVDWVYFKDTMDAVKDLQSKGYEVWSIEQVHESVSLEDFQVQKNHKYAVVFGNEVKGVRQDVVDESKGSIEIPQYGTKHSLNVAISAGIVIWDFFKKLCF